MSPNKFNEKVNKTERKEPLNPVLASRCLSLLLLHLSCPYCASAVPEVGTLKLGQTLVQIAPWLGGVWAGETVTGFCGHLCELGMPTVLIPNKVL